MSIKRIAKNIAFLSISEIVVKALQIIIIVYIARILKEAEFGKYNFAIAFSSIAVIIVDIGLYTLLIREISRNKEIALKYLSNTITLKIFLSIISFLLVILTLNLFGYSNEIRLIVYFFYGAFILKSFSDIFGAIFLAYEKMEWDAIIKTLRAVILALSVFYILFNQRKLLLIGWMYILTEGIILILSMYILIKKFMPIKIDFEFNFMKSLFKESIPFALTLIFYNIYFYIDTLMLSKMKSPYEVGIYGAAYTIPVALISIPFIYTSAIFPLLSRYYISSKDSLAFTYERSLKYMAVIGLFFSIVLFFGSSQIINFLYNGYRESGLVLKIIAIVVFFRCVSYLNGVVLASIDMQNARVKWQGITSMLNIALNLILIPGFSYIGSAIATIISELVLLLGYLFILMRYMPKKVFLSLLKPFIALLFVTPIAIIKSPIAIPVSIAIFILGLFFLRVFDKEDVGILRRIFYG